MGKSDAREIYAAFDFENSDDPEAHEVAANVSADYACDWVTAHKISNLKMGDRFMAKDPDWNRRCVLALAEQAKHWRQQEGIQTEVENDNDFLKGFSGKYIHPRDMLIGIRYVIVALMRRKLPLTDSDLITLAQACVESRSHDYLGIQPAAFVKQVGAFCNQNTPSDELRQALKKLAEYARSPECGEKKAAANLVSLIESDDQQASAIVSVIPDPAPVGSADMLVDLKVHLGIASPLDQERVLAEGDYYEMYAESPLAEQHAEILRGVQAISRAWEHRRQAYERANYRDSKASDKAHNEYVAAEKRTLTNVSEYEGERFKLKLAACERRIGRYLSRTSYENYVEYDQPVAKIISRLEEQQVKFTREAAFDWLLYCSAVAGFYMPIDESVAELAERMAADQPLSDGERWVIHRLRAQAIDEPPMGALPEVAKRLSRLIDGDSTFLLVPSERWSDHVHTQVAAMSEADRSKWTQLLTTALTATSSKPSKKWAKEIAGNIESIGAVETRQRLVDWFQQVPSGRSFKTLGGYAGDTRGAADTINEGNATILRGLVWALTTVPDESTPRAIADLLATCIKKVPGVGPRAVKVANACVWSLGEMAALDDESIRMNALGQLARLKSRVTFKTTLKAIEKALDKAAAESGLPRDEIEEMAVPTYGLTEIGKHSEQLGDFTAELIVTGTTTTELKWIKPDGKPQKSVPKAVKDNFGDDLKELKAAAKDIQKMLPAQRDRIDQLHLKQKTWAYDTWLERYLDHPLVGTLARRLIWVFDHGEQAGKVAATWLDGNLVGADGQAAEIDPASAIVSLWHPIGHAEEEILAWRRFFEDREIKQPFKQAHREVYLLTDAERNTGTYSNRYASHIIKQHQYNALCAVRGWNNSLRLMVDDSYPASSILLPEWNLRAEFWVEGIGDDYGTDTNESGTYLYLATDQVRFYHIEAAESYGHAYGGGYESMAAGPGTDDINEPLPLELIPPLVLSEIMRDVDLFVGVASVGNDPNWSDGGPQGRYREYWQHASFGALTATAKTRREILERLVPRLKIADRCSFDDKFLIVRGDKRTYKIHLGSSNILMEPNDQYLCIVPGRGAGPGDKVFLPFEGDQRMAVILSKAMMLAEDTKIKDPTILSQLRR